MTQKCSYRGCKGKVVGSYTVDLDVEELLFCKKHKGKVGNAMLWAILGITEMAESTLGLSSKKKKVTPKMKAKK